MTPPRTIVVTSGDPCGIGPEIILKALSRPLPRPTRLMVVGNLSVFAQTSKRLKIRLPRWTAISPDGLEATADQPLLFLDLAHPSRFSPGKSSAQAGRAALDYVDAAIRLLQAGTAQGLVTAPVTKWAIQQAHRRFEGQTEYLAEALKAPFVVMMFVSDTLRVALLTRHLALRDVPRRVTKQLLRHTIHATRQGLTRWFGIRTPRLAICGLNPHAGEAGLFGREEQTVLAPVLNALRRQGARLAGPFAADGFFASAHSYDAVICWYHDQGLIPFKLLARDRGCQLSVGLPMVRTSPDHGSALDIAGRGVAHPGSMRYAIDLAVRLTGKGTG